MLHELGLDAGLGALALEQLLGRLALLGDHARRDGVGGVEPAGVHVRQGHAPRRAR